MKKYEYKYVNQSMLDISGIPDIDYLNHLGSDGWKFVTIIGDNAIFVKEISR